ncbi:hypothetical protein Q5530_01975 [Saccharothrix sp. BKS2]|uniref:Uncharacterized protein n=1 Tax=Saccharothrix lopnurensis TaxID=1670621 RepID=A0ABW1NZK5_9PSEU
MSGNRTRGLLRAAALLAVGTSPLLTSAANAAEAPTDLLDGKVGHSPEVGQQVVTPAADLVPGQSVQLPAPVPAVVPPAKAPHVAAPAGIGLPDAPRPTDPTGLTGGLLAPQARSLTPAESAPGIELPAVPELPVKAPRLP